MGDPVNLAVALIVVAVVSAWLTYEAWARQAARREVAESCTRCGQRTGAVGTGEVGGGRMCESCRAMTRRNYRAAFIFFASVGALFIVIASSLIAIDYGRTGTVSAATTLAVIAAGGALSVGTGLAIRHFGIKQVS